VPPEAATAAILTAHMIIFWLSQDSNVTPPVALASFTAAAIAKAPAMATGIASWKLAKGLYIVPLIMAYSPFLSGDPLVALKIFFFGVFGVYALAAAMQGCMERPIGWIERAIVATAGVACLWPGNILIDLAGLAGVVLFLVLNLRKPLPAPTQP
jgi:TRAP-type uncharacterized transport system fused permease subunit